jgi:hypothetical protein
MLFSDFLSSLEAPDGDNLYLTTQYEEEDEEEGDLDDSVAYQMLHEYCPPPLPPMLNKFPHRPSLWGNLIPQQVNLWVGSSRAKQGTSSGLHHDFHDNLYLLFAGEKRFTLFSPADALNLYTHGKIKKVHRNGLINYTNRDATRSDGATDLEIAQHRVDQLEARLDNMEEAGITAGPERENLERELKEAEEIQFGLIDPNLDMDDFDALMEGNGGDDFHDDFADLEDDDNEDEDEDEEESENGKPKKPSKAKANKYDEPSDDDDETALKEEPNSFSLITTAELHAMKPETLAKYPLLKKARRVTVHLKAGEMLYLPVGWFHEVTSFNSSSAKAQKGHIALNYWMHPPANDDYQHPYVDNYWQSKWKEMAELISDIGEAEKSGKRLLPEDEDLGEDEYVPRSKRPRQS